MSTKGRREMMTMIEEAAKAAPPPPSFWTPYRAMFCLGAANLVPWMTLLSLADYFAQLYHSNAMEFYFPAISTSALVATSAVLLVVGPRLSFHARIAWPTFFMSLCMLVVPAVDTGISAGVVAPEVGFILTLGAVLLNAVFSSVAQASLYALGSVIGDSSTEGLQTGNGLIGLVAVGLRLLTKLGLPPTPGMRTFCVSGLLILLASLLAFVALLNDPAVKAKLEAHERRRTARNVPTGRSDSVEGQGLGLAFEDEERDVYKEFEEGEGSWGSLDYPGGDPRLARHGPPSPVTVTVSAALSRASVETASVFLVFTTCLATFPGLTTSLVSTTWHLGDWFPLCLVATYNAMDLVGKGLPSRVRLLTSSTLPYAALAHLAFLPAFLVLAHPAWLPPLLRSDQLALLLVGALGMCTGYIGCSALVLGAERGRSPEECEVVGQVTSFGLMMGLSCGSIAGVVLGNFVA